MKKFMKKALATLLAIVLVSSSFVCFAAELNQEAVNLHRGQFKNYVLLGDSVASGYRDEMSENDEAFNEANQETTYYRVPGSYADVLTKAIIEDDTMIAFAGPGFRTIEVRYMLEDDFDGEDEYLFHPSQLNAVGDAGSEEFRAAYKKAIAEADLISLGVGGNDWGAYLGWVVTDIIEKERVADKFLAKAKEILKDSTMDLAMVEKLVEVAHLAGALPELLTTLPSALSYGLGNFYSNWDIMIQDIYNLNPDVTLMVLGMSDNSLKGKYFDYNGVEGEAIDSGEQNKAVAGIMTTIVEFIMSVGNKPMIEGAEKFGYVYVDTKGTTYVESHPDADGHIHIANKIIEALPDPDISKMFEDVNPGHKYYKAIEYVLKNNIMSSTSETTFSPDDAVTNGQLAEAFNAINKTNNATDDTSEVSTFKLATAFFSAGLKGGISGIGKGISICFKVIKDNLLNLGGTVSRGQTAYYLEAFCEG